MGKIDEHLSMEASDSSNPMREVGNYKSFGLKLIEDEAALATEQINHSSITVEDLEGIGCDSVHYYDLAHYACKHARFV